VAPTVTIGAINVSVDVAGTNASPQAIGDAAGNAVGSALRNYLADIPAGAALREPR